MEAKHLALYILLPLLVLGVVSWWIYGPSGAGSSLKKVTEKLKGFLPDVSLGAKPLEAEKPQLPPYHKEAVERLVNSIQMMVGSGRQHCFDSYGGLPDLEEKGTTIVLAPESIKVFILGGKQEALDLSQELTGKLKGFIPCVIATEQVVNSFERTYLNFLPWSEKEQLIQAQPPFAHAVSNIVIDFDGENKIDFGTGKKDLEDGGYLYVHGAADGYSFVCFFPTVEAIQEKNDGLNDDYLGEDKSPNSLTKQLREKRIPRCSETLEPSAMAQQPSPDEILPGGVAETG